MTVVFVTGMSGTGKSSALADLARRGYRVVDTDYGSWTRKAPSADGRPFEPLWDEERIAALLATRDEGILFVSGCVANQDLFYSSFDAVVLLAARDTNDYGKTDEQRAFILRDLAAVEPLLRARATAEVDTNAPLGDVVGRLESIAHEVSRRTDLPVVPARAGIDRRLGEP